MASSLPIFLTVAMVFVSASLLHFTNLLSCIMSELLEVVNQCEETPLLTDICGVINALNEVPMDTRVEETALAAFCGENEEGMLLTAISVSKNKAKELRSISTHIEALIEQLEYRIAFVETFMLIKEAQQQTATAEEEE